MENQIIRTLSKRAEEKINGSDFPICSGELLGLLKMFGFKTDDYMLRKTVGDICRNKKGMIGSCDEGFFLIKSELDMKVAKGYILHRIEPMVKRVNAINDMWLERNGSIQDLLL